MNSRLFQLSTSAIVGFGLISAANAQLFNLTETGNNFLSNPLVNGVICTSLSVVGNLFTNEIKDLIDSQLDGTSEDVPLPYEELIILGVEPPALNGCNMSISVNFKLTNVLQTKETLGTADIEGLYEPGLTFFDDDGAFIPGVQACMIGLYVSDLDIEDEGQIYEEFVRDFINGELGDPECAIILGGEDEEETDDEDGDGDGDDGGDGDGDDGGDGDGDDGGDGDGDDGGDGDGDDGFGSDIIPSN